MRGGAILFVFPLPTYSRKKLTRKPTLTGIAHQRNTPNNPILPPTFLGSSRYVFMKHALNRLHEFIALGNPNVPAVLFHPGLVLTSIMEDLKDFKPFALDRVCAFPFFYFGEGTNLYVSILIPKLAGAFGGAFAVYLTTERQSLSMGNMRR